jgi:hypothetical protein
MSNHSIRKCATKLCQVVVSSHDNSLLGHVKKDLREGTCDETSLGGCVDSLFCRS